VASGPSKIAQVNGREEVPQGISEASRKATKARSKIPAQAGETELEGEIAQRDRIRPTRQVPSQLIWRDRETVKFERAAVKQPTGAFRWTRKNTLFDNRKAGKSTPITLCPDYGRAGCHGVDYIQVCSSRAKLWKKRRLIQSFEDRRNESPQPIPG
jgi:hypothetical protein